MSKPMDYYWQEQLVRTQKKMREWARNQQMSCVHCPLLNISLTNVILDELHLMLRVTGRVHEQYTCTYCITLFLTLKIYSTAYN